MPTPILKADKHGVFYAHWSDNRRSKRKSMGSSERAVAEARFAQWLLLGGHRGVEASEGKPALTVAEMWKVYDAKHVQRETAAADTIGYAWKNLEPHFGALAAAEIDQTVVDDYEDLRAAGRIGRPAKSGTVRRELVALRACLNWCASPERGKFRLLDKADVPAFVLPDESAPRERWLTNDELNRLFAAAAAMHPGEPRMSRGERFLWLALETAARKQAILDLTWDRVDFETGVIHYDVPGRKTTKKRRTSVPISARLRPVLERAKREAVNEFVMDHGGEVWATVQSIVVRAGLAPKEPRGTGKRPRGTGVSPHTFRHTAATHMARRGVPLWLIAKILGNTLAMVERVYAKHSPEDLRAAVNLISCAPDGAQVPNPGADSDQQRPTTADNDPSNRLAR